MEKIGERLSAYFKENGITQEQIASQLGVSQSYVNALLNDKKAFGKKQAQKWFEEFGISPNWLLTGEGEMLKKPTGPEAELEQMIAEQTYEALMRAYEKGEIYPGAVVKQMINEKDEKIEGLQKRLWELEHENETLKEELSAYKKK